MHIVIVTDQHPDSLGGAQVSIRLQRTYLERAGHRVTIVAPRRHASPTADPTIIALPSLPITHDRDYAASWPGKRSVRRVVRALAEAPGVDLVHVQGDFWGALIGVQLAEQLGVPVVTTLHNNLDVGTRAVTRAAPIVFAVLQCARRLLLGPSRVHRDAAVPAASDEAGVSKSPGPRGGWAYLAELAARSDAVVAPSRHFAESLAANGVADRCDVIATGVDDDEVARILTGALEPAGHAVADRQAVSLVWCGRMSPEKRVLELLEAFALVRARGLSAGLVVVGSGLQYDEARARAEALGISAQVRFTGSLPYAAALAEIARADALVQTSRGFETQGMTPYEATALGTPTVFADPNIAAEIAAPVQWVVEGDSVNDLARALEQAVRALGEAGAAGDRLRIEAAFAAGMHQSQRTADMLRVYERVLA